MDAPTLPRVALTHAILVSLCEQSGSGYELAHRAMEEDGWARATPVAQQGRPDKKVYIVSAAGRAELARGIAEPLTGRVSALNHTRTRDIAVKLRGAGYGDVAALRSQIAALRAEHAELLNTYLGSEKRQFPDPQRCTALHHYLVLRGGIRAEESVIDWLDEAVTALSDPKRDTCCRRWISGFATLRNRVVMTPSAPSGKARSRRHDCSAVSRRKGPPCGCQR